MRLTPRLDLPVVAHRTLQKGIDFLIARPNPLPDLRSYWFEAVVGWSRNISPIQVLKLSLASRLRAVGCGAWSAMRKNEAVKSLARWLAIFCVRPRFWFVAAHLKLPHDEVWAKLWATYCKTNRQSEQSSKEDEHFITVITFHISFLWVLGFFTHIIITQSHTDFRWSLGCCAGRAAAAVRLRLSELDVQFMLLHMPGAMVETRRPRTFPAQGWFQNLKIISFPLRGGKRQKKGTTRDMEFSLVSRSSRGMNAALCLYATEICWDLRYQVTFANEESAWTRKRNSDFLALQLKVQQAATSSWM